MSWIGSSTNCGPAKPLLIIRSSMVLKIYKKKHSKTNTDSVPLKNAHTVAKMSKIINMGSTKSGPDDARSTFCHQYCSTKAYKEQTQHLMLVLL